MTKEILLTATYLVGAGELILAIYFWVTNSKSEIRRVMAFVSFFAGMWVISSALSAYNNPTTFVLIALSLVYVFGAFLNTSFLHLAIIFPYPNFHFDRLHKFLMYIPALIFSVIAVSTKTIVESFNITPATPGIVISGPLHDIYNYFILINFILILGLLLYKANRTDGVNRRLILIVFFSIFLGGIFPIWFDVLVPSFFPQFIQVNYLYGSIGTALWLGITTYIVSKK